MVLFLELKRIEVSVTSWFAIYSLQSELMYKQK